MLKLIVRIALIALLSEFVFPALGFVVSGGSAGSLLFAGSIVLAYTILTDLGSRYLARKMIYSGRVPAFHFLALILLPVLPSFLAGCLLPGISEVSRSATFAAFILVALVLLISSLKINCRHRQSGVRVGKQVISRKDFRRRIGL